jgi:uncharacterized protein YukE
MTDPDVPLNSRGTPRQRFDPLRDGPRPENDDFAADMAELERQAENGLDPATGGLISAVQRQIAALGLSASWEGQSAVALAEKVAESTGSAAAACAHELRMLMNQIATSKPAAESKDATEDVLSRRRERKAGA